MRHWFALMLLLCLPAGAKAKWLEASSAHFVIYANDSEANLRTYASRLESFDAALTQVTNFKSPPPTPSARVTVFIVKNVDAVRKLLGDDSQKFIGAFYVPRVEGSIAIVPDLWLDNGDIAEGLTPLLHEYVHHFMLSQSAFPEPAWFSEGTAEFFAAASFKRGQIWLGQPNVNRGWELFNARDVTVSDLFDRAAYEKKRKADVYDSFYGKSWLLYHYLVTTKNRPGQLESYLKNLVTGKGEIDAARAAFGDFDKLESELDRYQRSTNMMMIRVPMDGLTIAPIAIRALSSGEAEMMPIRIRSKRGVDREQATTLLGDARAVAARYPTDGAVLAALAEAEYDAGHDAEAIAAADAAIAADPSQKNAYVQKGYALFRRAFGAKDQAAAYAEAIKPFLALNKMENDHPLPLLYFYLSYSRQGKAPTKTAIGALEQAMGLAPFDLRLRQLWATQLINDGRLAEARKALEPLAYAPHGGSPLALQLIEKIDAGTAPQRIIVQDLFSGQPDRQRPAEIGSPVSPATPKTPAS